MSATLAPRIEIYTILACSVHKPEYTMNPDVSKRLGLPYIKNDSDLLVSKPLPGFGTSPLIPTIASENEITSVGLLDGSNDTEGVNKDLDRCTEDPEVQAAVAKLTAG